MIASRTALHFAGMMQLLATQLCVRPKSILVKNVGDSLMIRIDAIPGNEIAQLLRQLLQAQESLHDNGTTGKPLDIRVLVARCSEAVIDGEDIAPRLQKLLNLPPEALETKLPGKRGTSSWLWGDLFGPDVARAFRSSSIPKGRELVVEDSVAQLLGSVPDAGGAIGELLFGPRVAFSPIKGMQDLYDLQMGPIEKPGQQRHVWLRTVTLANGAPIAEDPLVLRQQQFRVITELAIENDKAVSHWIKVLRHIDNDAGYMRLFGRVQLVDTWTRNKAENHARTNLLVLGAYPEFDTYFHFREGIQRNKEYYARRFGLKYALSHVLWEATLDTQKVTWSPLTAEEPFLVILGQPHAIEDNPHSLAGTAWYKVITDLDLPGFERLDQGLVMGEWNHYAVFTRTADGACDWKAMSAICRAAFADSMRRIRVFGCETIVE